MEHKRKIDLIDRPSGVAFSEDSEKINLDDLETLSLQIIHGAAETTETFEDGDVDVDEDTITITGHGLVTGADVALTTSGSLPGGLSATDYFVIVVDADTIQLATSLSNAQAGTAVDITSAAGGGTHTLTHGTKGGAVQVQVSNVDNPSEDADWTNKGSATNISGAAASAVIEYEAKDLSHKWMRVEYTHTDGQYPLEVIANAKG